MATNTYVALDKITISGSSTSTITFTSINQSYTDLVLIVNAQLVSGGAANNYIRFNGDTGTNYSATICYGTGSAAGSYRSTNNSTGIIFDDITSTERNTDVVNIMNYSNATTYKSTVTRSSPVNSAVQMSAGLWRSTAAITSLTITNPSGSWAAGSTFSLYGIAAEGTSPAPKATGGAIYSDSTYYYHVFGSTGTFTPLQSLTADVLVVAGGGGGSSYRGGGGGAGGLLAFTSQALSATAYTCTVGAGGSGGVDSGRGSSGGDAGTNGGDSQFGSLTLVKGGGYGGAPGITPANAVGNAGGSGGGGAADPTSGAVGGAATSGQGYAGGTGLWANTFYAAGGGGGAGGAGVNANGSNGGGAGGVGSSAYSSWGAATGTGQNSGGTYYFAGGGAGGAYTGIAGTNTVAGGLGGGGSAPATIAGATSNGNAGTANTGGGGAGTLSTDGTHKNGGNGGSGIVIVRYAK